MTNHFTTDRKEIFRRGFSMGMASLVSTLQNNRRVLLPVPIFNARPDPQALPR
jgi:hypothetical protein